MAGSNYDLAMDKIRDEMAKCMEHAGILALGEHLTELLEQMPEAAEAILEKEKTLAGAFKALESHARKQAHGKGCVVISDQEGFGIAERYYGIVPQAEAAKKPEPAAPAAPEKEDPFDLDSLLGL